MIMHLALLAMVVPPAQAGEAEKGFAPLLGKDLAGWVVVPESAGKTFALRKSDGTECLASSGRPLAYLHTEKEYVDFTLRLEWKMAKEGRSGILFHVTPPHKIWPASIQVQLQDADHGRVFPFGGAEGSFTFNKLAMHKAVKPGEWNELELRVVKGKVASTINGVDISAGTTKTEGGVIAIQSEEGEVLFRNIRIRAEK